MWGLQRFTVVIASQLFRRATYSGNALRSSTNVAAAASVTKQNVTNKTNVNESTEPSREEEEELNPKKPKGSLVAAAFENLKNGKLSQRSSTKISPVQIDERIINAKTVNNLLVLAEGNVTLTRRHALRIVSILADWSSMNRVKLTEFENDARFLRICRMLGRSPPKEENKRNDDEAPGRVSGFRTDDLNTVLGVAGDDEAAKLIANISLTQMVKVMSILAFRKRRSIPLLRSLAFNISSSSETLDLKQCADVFYAMATLNFQDSVLAAKLCIDIQADLPKNDNKSAVVGSILTSLGLLKYRDLDILETLTQWILQHSDICRPQDLSAFFHSSAILNFKTTQLSEVRSKLVNALVQHDFKNSYDWLTHVWSLAMMGISDNKHLESVLSTAFIEKLQTERLTATIQMKILNLNSYAQLVATNYKGPLLPKDSKMFEVPLVHSKSKQVLVNGTLDALKSLLPATNHVQTSQDSRMGFFIDALCLFDAKRNPLPLNKDHPQGIKVALMVVDYHDVCQGAHKAASGITALNFELLEKSGYRVLPVPYNEFNTSDKLLKRVQYLEGKIKTIINNEKIKE